MKYRPVDSSPAPRRLLLCALIAAAFALVPSSVFAESMFKVGLGEFDSALTDAGKVCVGLIKLGSLGVIIWGFYKFIKEKKWIDLVYIVVGIAGVGYAEKITLKLFNLGGGIST